MTIEQQLLIDKSFKLIAKLDPIKFLLDMALYIIGVLAILFLIMGRFDWIFAITVPFMTSIYLLVKYVFLIKQVKKTISNQFFFIENSHPKASLYIPMMDKTGKKFYLKRAALYIINDMIYMDALRQRTFSSVPEEAITIPYGDEFYITSITKDELNGVAICEGTLIDTAYRFIVINDTNIIQRLESLIRLEKKEV